jgi:hypothetical protein
MQFFGSLRRPYKKTKKHRHEETHSSSCPLFSKHCSVTAATFSFSKHDGYELACMSRTHPALTVFGQEEVLQASRRRGKEDFLLVMVNRILLQRRFVLVSRPSCPFDDTDFGSVFLFGPTTEDTGCTVFDASDHSNDSVGHSCSRNGYVPSGHKGSRTGMGFSRSCLLFAHLCNALRSRFWD